MMMMMMMSNDDHHFLCHQHCHHVITPIRYFMIQWSPFRARGFLDIIVRPSTMIQLSFFLAVTQKFNRWPCHSLTDLLTDSGLYLFEFNGPTISPFFTNFCHFLPFSHHFHSFHHFFEILWPENWHLRLWLHVTLETLITLLTIENKIWTITLWPLNREWWWQHSQFLRCYYYYLSLEVWGPFRKGDGGFINFLFNWEYCCVTSQSSSVGLFILMAALDVAANARLEEGDVNEICFPISWSQLY